MTPPNWSPTGQELNLMAKSKSKQGKQGKKKARGNQNAPRKRGLSPKELMMKSYDLLMRDPCNADFCYPPYAGTDTGYLVRVTANLQPKVSSTGLTPGASMNGNFLMSIQPSSFPVFNSGASLTTTITAGLYTHPNVFLSSATVRSYRAVAACVKWVPTGPVGGRCGLISVGYSPGLTVQVGANDVDQLSSNSIERCSNGGGSHEIRWLPTANDEVFNPFIAAQQWVAGGVNTISGKNVDGVVTSTTELTLNGFVEYTAVYEWIPALASGLQSQPKTPPPFSSQEYLSTIQDLGAFLLQGVRRVGSSMAMGVVQGSVTGFLQASSSRGSARVYGAGMPLIGN